ncbi:family 10 glycosylhydrolase [Candidatus Bathyarchaeota archaeon]|nr:family 10 glycosylhydrolase [Candidatus Bathyarchaeota archaeon]
MVLVVIILSTILGTSLVMAQFKMYYTISSSGSISTDGRILHYKMTDNSEIRAVFFHFTSLSASNDWNLIVNTLYDYGINLLVVEGMMPKYAGYPSDVISASAGLDFINEALEVAHPLGIEVYVAMNVLYQTPNPEWGCVDSQGNFIDWLCPTKQEARDYLRAIVEELVTKYPNIDGFMFDYIRWEWQGSVPDMDYSEESRTALGNWLGETVTNFPGEFAPSGSRYNEFLEWRVEVITQLLVDIIGWMKAIKPDLKISAAPWTILKTGLSYEWAERRKLIGQDWTDWVMKDYLDWVAPMAYFYPNELETFLRPCVKADVELGVGGPEGKIPMIIFVANQFPILKTPEEFKAEIDILREEGVDGWIIWRYGGPGAGGLDIRDYLNALNLSPVFSMEGITVYLNEQNESATITWTTNIPTISRVEYSISPLFNVNWQYDSKWNFSYLDIEHIEGEVVENLQRVIDHSITLANLDPNATYYFRVQSQDSGIITSKVYEFSISGLV